MTKRIIVLLLIAAVAFAQLPRFVTRQNQKLSGGYHKSDPAEIQMLLKAAPFLDVQQAARDFYAKHAGGDLGDIVGVEKQIVSGINFKLTFAVPDVADQTVEIDVYSQPWTKTIVVTSVHPPIEGVTDQSGRVVADIMKN